MALENGVYALLSWLYPSMFIEKVDLDLTFLLAPVLCLVGDPVALPCWGAHSTRYPLLSEWLTMAAVARVRVRLARESIVQRRLSIYLSRSRQYLQLVLWKLIFQF